MDNHHLSLVSASWLFSAEKFDLGTRILLKHLIVHTKDTANILDLGCGYGLVSTYITDQYKKNNYPDISHLHIDACDSSPLAVEVTHTNLQSHKSTPNFSFHTQDSDILSDSYFLKKSYDIIISNPPFSAGKQVVKEFIRQAYNHLRPGGRLWLVVPTNKWAKSYITINQEIFGEDAITIVAIEAWYRVRYATK